MNTGGASREEQTDSKAEQTGEKTQTGYKIINTHYRATNVQTQTRFIKYTLLIGNKHMNKRTNVTNRTLSAFLGFHTV